MAARRRIRVVLYTTGPDCSLCERTEVDLGLLAREFPLGLSLVDVRSDEGLRARFGERVPVVEVEGLVAAEGRVSPAALRVALERVSAGGEQR